MPIHCLPIKISVKIHSLEIKWKRRQLIASITRFLATIQDCFNSRGDRDLQMLCDCGKMSLQGGVSLAYASHSVSNILKCLLIDSVLIYT